MRSAVEGTRRLSPELVKSHAFFNRIPSNERTIAGQKCGDGRDEQEYVHAIFGASLGYVYATLGAINRMAYIGHYDSEVLVRAVFEDVIAQNGFVDIHTDSHTHAKPDMKYARGCGANRLAHENPPRFGLTQKDILAIETVTEEYVKKGKVRNVVYKGDHNEGAVLLVKGPSGIKAKGKDSSVFVLHLDSIHHFLDVISVNPQILEYLKISSEGEKNLFRTELERIWEMQTEYVRQQLANDSDHSALPVFEVNYLGIFPRVKEVNLNVNPLS